MPIINPAKLKEGLTMKSPRPIMLRKVALAMKQTFWQHEEQQLDAGGSEAGTFGTAPLSRGDAGACI